MAKLTPEQLWISNLGNLCGLKADKLSLKWLTEQQRNNAIMKLRRWKFECLILCVCVCVPGVKVIINLKGISRIEV